MSAFRLSFIFIVKCLRQNLRYFLLSLSLKEIWTLLRRHFNYLIKFWDPRNYIQPLVLICFYDVPPPKLNLTCMMTTLLSQVEKPTKKNKTTHSCVNFILNVNCLFGMILPFVILLKCVHKLRRKITTRRKWILYAQPMVRLSKIFPKHM